MSGNVSSGSFGSSSNVSPQIMQSVSFSFDGKNDGSAKRHFFKYSEPSSSVKFFFYLSFLCFFLIKN